MNIKINGEEKQLEKEVNMIEFLQIHNVEMPEMVSVELNGELIDSDEYEGTIIKDSDTIEFLYFMGGGSIGF